MSKINKKIPAYLICEMIRESMDNSYEYLPPVIEDNKIKIIPKDSNTSFKDVYLSSEPVHADNQEDQIRIFGLPIIADIELIDTTNDDFHVGVNDLGEVFIDLDINNQEDSGVGFITGVKEELEDKEESEEPKQEPISTNSEEEKTEVPEDPKIDTSKLKASVLNEAELSDEEGPQWIVHYDLGSTNESLNEAEETTPENVETITAPDIETAVKYAEQNARIKAKENTNWSEAEIVSIKKKES